MKQMSRIIVTDSLLDTWYKNNSFFILFYLPLGDVDEREEFLEKSFVYRQLERQQAELF